VFSSDLQDDPIIRAREEAAKGTAAFLQFCKGMGHKYSGHSEAFIKKIPIVINNDWSLEAVHQIVGLCLNAGYSFKLGSNLNLQVQSRFDIKDELPLLRELAQYSCVGSQLNEEAVKSILYASDNLKANTEDIKNILVGLDWDLDQEKLDRLISFPKNSEEKREQNFAASPPPSPRPLSSLSASPSVLFRPRSTRPRVETEQKRRSPSPGSTDEKD
jgi:hypothetical protein